MQECTNHFQVGMLASDLQEGMQTFVNIDEEEEIVSALLWFMYTRAIPWHFDCLNLVRLLKLADCYQTFEFTSDTTVKDLRSQLERRLPPFHEVKLFHDSRELLDEATIEVELQMVSTKSSHQPRLSQNSSLSSSRVFSSQWESSQV